ncbi:MAG TPA: hypothetical protein VK721_03020 [Solirubrobacteraceae bacterium]|jgi:hypothetical protein|nr:hypothetical protein [Solirubrobacteraceae bacterium]
MQLPRHRAHPANPRCAGTAPERRRRRARTLVGAVALLCVLSATLGGALAYANGQPVRGGVKNPTFGGFFGTTQIWANNSTWGTRQSNLGSGGSAIYGCRSLKGGLPCLDADNLKGGPAFEFITTGAIGGSILVANSSAAPFTTNGHGVATGLNANYLQGKQASEFQLANQPAANANELGGQPPSSYVSTGQLLFADVGPGPVIQNTRGATTVGQLETTYTVVFGTTNVSKCSFTASPQGAALTAGQLGVAPSASNVSAVVVTAPGGFAGGFDLQVAC